MEADQPVVRRREWTDDAGRRWRRRGGLLARKRTRSLLEDPATTVLLFGRPTPVWVEPVDRAALWQRLAPFLEGRPSRPVGQEDYEAAEFVSEGKRLLALYEYC